MSSDPGWEYAQFDKQTDGDGFRMYDILDDLFNRGYLAACYGPTGQNTSAANVFNIAALLGSLISTNVQTTPSDSYIRDDNRWTPLRGYYESAAATHQIALTAFQPHATACDLSKVCPDE